MNSAPTDIKIWDVFVRMFHWSVATLFLLDFWVLEDGDPPHEWAGYALLVLVLMRVVWGFIGSHHARFSSFFPTPARVKQHLIDLKAKQIDPAEGHNPLGGAMVLLLLFMLILVGVSGWMQTWDKYWGEDWVENLHETSAEITMILVVIHVAAVFIMTKLTGIPLLRTMLTGKRPGQPIDK